MSPTVLTDIRGPYKPPFARGISTPTATVTMASPDTSPNSATISANESKQRDVRSVSSSSTEEATSCPGAPKTFEKFNELPGELRLKIWKFASHIQRNVDIIPMYIFEGSNEQLHCFRSNCPQPTVLAICQESRAEALRYYTVDFTAEVDSAVSIKARDRLLSSVTRSDIYINWDVDRVCVMSLHCFILFFATSTKRPQQVAQLFQSRKLRYLAINIGNHRFEGDAALTLTPSDGSIEEVVFFSCTFNDAVRLKSFDFVDEADENDIGSLLPMREKVCNEYVNSTDDLHKPPRIRFCTLGNIQFRRWPFHGRT